MNTPLAFFKFVVKAALNAVGGGVAGDFAVEVLPGVARDVWIWWGKGRPEEQLRAEVQAVAQMSDEQARTSAEHAVAEEAPNQPSALRLELVTFLAQVPSAIRRSQRRPADPLGYTV